MERKRLHEEAREQPNRADTDHDLPDNSEAVRKRFAHLGAEWLGERRNDGNGGVGDRNAAGELFDEVCRELLPKLRLQYGGSDGDAPDL